MFSTYPKQPRGMGKTRQTYRNAIDAFEQNADDFRRALSEDYQDALDEVLRQINLHSMAGDALNSRDPKTAMWLSVVVHQQHRIDELEEKLDELDSC